MHVVGESHHADLIALAAGHVGEEQGRVDDVIQFGDVGHRALHHPADVQDDHDILASFRLVLNGHRPVAAGRRLPVDAPVLVVGQVLA